MIGPHIQTLAWIVLQTANETGYRDSWLSGDVFAGAFGPFLDALGPLFIVIGALGVGGILYIFSGSMSLPLVAIILISGYFIPHLPPAARAMVQLLLVAGIAYALYHAWMYGGSKRL